MLTALQLAPVMLGLAGLGLAWALRRGARPGVIRDIAPDRPRPPPLPLVPLDPPAVPPAPLAWLGAMLLLAWLLYQLRAEL